MPMAGKVLRAMLSLPACAVTRRGRSGAARLVVGCSTCAWFHGLQAAPPA
jgi:hypothetical protein